MHAMLARLAGAAKIIMGDLSGGRLKICKEIMPSVITAEGGARHIVDDVTSGKGANVVITACGSPAAQAEALEIAGLDGRVCFFGGLPKGKGIVGLDTNLIHYKQLSVIGTTRASHAHYRKTLRMCADGLIDIDPLITHRFALDQINMAFENTLNTIGLKQAVIF
jgi:L-iditol 2-dehydrogenase